MSDIEAKVAEMCTAARVATEDMRRLMQMSAGANASRFRAELGRLEALERDAVETWSGLVEPKARQAFASFITALGEVIETLRANIGAEP